MSTRKFYAFLSTNKFLTRLSLKPIFKFYFRFKFLMLSGSAQKNKEYMKIFKEYAAKVRDNIETEVSFKPAASEATASPKKRKRDDEEEDMPPSKWSLMYGPGYNNRATVIAKGKKQKDKLQIEIDFYMEEEELAVDADPLSWWKTNESRFPILSLVAKKYLATPATSVPCERLFSIAGEVITKKRAKLGVGHAEMYVFLKAYYNMED